LNDNLFNPDYIDFDDFGHVEVRCMRCGTPVMARTELPTKEPNVKAIGMKKNSAYRQVDRPGKAPIICCQQCEPLLKDLVPEEEERVESVHMYGWVSGMVWAGKSDETIKEFVRRSK
jgi:hypothetical protein